MRALLMCGFIAATLLAPIVVADHPQPISGGEQMIVFDHKAGNEWWVEVKVTVPEDHYRVDFVYARSEKGTFKSLELKPWGHWAASFRIPPGERVQFYAGMAGGMSNVFEEYSCLFTHPAGVEQCAPGQTDETTWTFTNVKGNEWWEEVTVTSNRPVANVFMVVDDVNDHRSFALTKRSWGAWAVSVFVPQGSDLWFLANDGASGGKSACYRWVQASVVECPATFGPNPAAPFMTRFDHRGGNEWWVEMDLGPIPGSGGPDQVFARDDGGPWVPMTLRDWGNWATSFRIEPGHRVQFKAIYEDDFEDQRTSCWFTHNRGLSPEGAQICRNLESQE